MIDNQHMAKRRAHRPEGSRPIDLLESEAAAPSVTRTVPATNRTPSGRRAAFDRASRPWLVRMAALPTPVIPAVMAGMLLAGLAIRAPWAGALLIAIALFLSWLTAVSWPAVSPASRALRVVVNGGVLVLGILKILGLA